MSESFFARHLSLRGRILFITGGASGIGASKSRISPPRVRRSRSSMVNDDAAAALTKAVRESGDPEPLYQHCDLKDIGVLRKAIHTANDRFWG